MTPAQKRLHDLIEARERAFTLLQVRKTLGGFDTNAEAIIVLLEIVLASVNYQITLAEEKKK